MTHFLFVFHYLPVGYASGIFFICVSMCQCVLFIQNKCVFLHRISGERRCVAGGLPRQWPECERLQDLGSKGYTPRAAFPL